MITDVVALNKILRIQFRKTLSLPENFFRRRNVAGVPRGTDEDPEAPYGTILIQNVKPIGIDAESSQSYDQYTKEFQQKIRGMREADVSIHFYRDNAHLNAATLMQQLRTSIYKEFFGKTNIALMYSSTIRNLDELDNEEFIMHANFDMHINFQDTYEFLINSYDKFPYKILYGDEELH